MDTILTLDHGDPRAHEAPPDASPPRTRAADLDFSAVRLTEPARLPTSPPTAVETEHVMIEEPRRRRPMRAFMRFVVTVALGVGGTLAWQSYGDAGRLMVATLVPQLAWIAPAPSASPPMAAEPTVLDQTAALQGTPVGATAGEAALPVSLPPEVMQQFETMARDLAAARQGLQQLTTNQDQLAQNIAKLQATEQDILHKLTPPARPAVAAAPRPPQPPGGPQLSSVPRPAGQPLQTAPVSSTPLPPPQRAPAQLAPTQLVPR